MIQILGLSAIALLTIKYFSPVQPIREWIVGKIIRFMVRYNQFWLQPLVQVLSCPFCFATWLTLIVTFSIYKAAIAGVLTMILLHCIEALNKYLYENDDDE